VYVILFRVKKLRPPSVYVTLYYTVPWDDMHGLCYYRIKKKKKTTDRHAWHMWSIYQVAGDSKLMYSWDRVNTNLSQL
jgi:hypothetical protein